MSDKPLFELNEKYQLAYDQHQWIVQVQEGVRQKGDHAGEKRWRAISFIGSHKRHLWRVFGEKDILLTDEAVGKVDALADTFFDFLRDHDPASARRHPIWRAAQAGNRHGTGKSRQSRPQTTQEPETAVDDASLESAGQG